VTITPHNAAAIRPQALVANVLAQIERFEDGTSLAHVVDRAAGYQGPDGGTEGIRSRRIAAPALGAPAAVFCENAKSAARVAKVCARRSLNRDDNSQAMLDFVLLCSIFVLIVAASVGRRREAKPRRSNALRE